MAYAVEIKSLSKRYASGTHALQDVHLAIDEGDFFALLGPNGAGKSSLIGILCSLVRKTSGQVRLFGIDIDQDFAQARQYLGVVPQDFNFSVFENPMQIILNQAGYYGLLPYECRSHAEYCLKRLDLWDKRNVPCQQLSGGMKRRLMIARALVHKPRLLILDEPTAGVDVEIRRNIYTFLEEISQNGTTIVLTTHYLEEAERLCKNVGLLNEGRLVKQSSMDAILRSSQFKHLIIELSEPMQQVESLESFELTLRSPTELWVRAAPQHDLHILFQHLSRNHIGIRDIRQRSNRLENLLLSLSKKKP